MIPKSHSWKLHENTDLEHLNLLAVYWFCTESQRVQVSMSLEINSSIKNVKGKMKNESRIRASGCVQKKKKEFFQTHLNPTTRCHPCSHMRHLSSHSFFLKILHTEEIYNGTFFVASQAHCECTIEVGWGGGRWSLCENCFLLLILSFHVYWMSFMMILCVERSEVFLQLSAIWERVMLLRNLILETWYRQQRATSWKRYAKLKFPGRILKFGNELFTARHF